MAVRDRPYPSVLVQNRADAVLDAGAVATMRRYGYGSAACGGREMSKGRHYARFTIGEVGRASGRPFSPSCAAYFGVVGPGFHPNCSADESFKPYTCTAYCAAWMLHTRSGMICHAGYHSEWEGQPRFKDGTKLKVGDVVVRTCPSPAPRALFIFAAAHTLSVRCSACCSTSTRRP